MCIGISFLGQPIWIMFYKYNEVSIDIFKFFIFTAGSFAVYSVIINIAQTLNHTKQVLITLTSAFILNLIDNIPFMILCHYIGIPAYHGAIVSTLIITIIGAKEGLCQNCSLEDAIQAYNILSKPPFPHISNGNNKFQC